MKEYWQTWEWLVSKISQQWGKREKDMCRYLREGSEGCTEGQYEQQGWGGPEATQGVPGALLEVAVDVEEAMQDTEAHV